MACLGLNDNGTFVILDNGLTTSDGNPPTPTYKENLSLGSAYLGWIRGQFDEDGYFSIKIANRFSDYRDKHLTRDETGQMVLEGNHTISSPNYLIHLERFNIFF